MNMTCSLLDEKYSPLRTVQDCKIGSNELMNGRFYYLNFVFNGGKYSPAIYG